MGAAARRTVLPLACAGLTLLVLAPVLRPGFVLVYDMVFTPRQPLLAESVGLGPALPRAVPADAVVALLSAVLPGALVQKAVLFAAVWAAAYGAARLVPTTSTPVQLVAAAGYGWNAYLAERLFLGHWALLVGYAALPWVVVAALRLRRGEPRAWAALALAMAPAVLVPTGGLLAAGAAVASAGRRRFPVVAGTAVVLNAPWWVPGVLHGGGAVSDPAAVAAFGARAEGPGGALVSLLGLGGIWNADAAPASRQGLLVPLVALLLVAGAAFGVRPLAAAWGRAPVVALAALAGSGLLAAAAAAVPGADAALRCLVAHVPGAGLLRDGQKWVAWWALLAAPAGALAVERLTARMSLPGVRVAVLAGAAVLPLAVLPDLAWGGAGRLEPVRYPHDWAAVREVLAADGGRGTVLVLPFQPYRQFGWNDRRTQLDPAPRFLPHGAVVADTLSVGGRPLRGEDVRAAAAGRALLDPSPAEGRRALARLGVGWLLVSHGTPGDPAPPLLADLPTVYTGPWLTLYRLPGPISTGPPGEVPWAPVLLADAAALAMVAAGLLRLWLPAGTFRAIVTRAEKGGTGAHCRWHCRLRAGGRRAGGRGHLRHRAGQRTRPGGRGDDREA